MRNRERYGSIDVKENFRGEFDGHRVVLELCRLESVLTDGLESFLI